ncbi:hypothetical protein ACMHYO_12155 [Allopusillimonas ginsengisoli]|uniref:hypothetical protein n=1 Tax=Allopusillimonas ginsengisoli TaxID=453575 RepID=UPI0039C1CAF4
MNRFVLAFLASVTFVVSGCSTVADFRPVVKDGQEYVYGMPVIAIGTLEDVQVTEKNGAIHSFAAAGADLTSDGGIAGPVANSINGLTSLQGTAALSLASGVLDFVSRVNGPSIKLMVRPDNGGDTLVLPVSKQSLYILGRNRCVGVGDRVRIVRKGKNGFDIYNAVPSLLHLSDFEPTCEELKAALKSNSDKTAAQ